MSPTVPSMWSLKANRSIAAFGEPLTDLGFGVEIVGLVAQMEAGVGGELRTLPFDRLHQAARIVGAAQARLPRTGRGVKHRGDAVADRLAVAVGERHVDREVDPGARHHLPLEGIAMQIDDARQHQQVARVDRKPRPAARGIDLGDVLSGQGKRRLDELGADQGPAALKENVCHAIALRLLPRELLRELLRELPRASYVARKSSIPSLRKSGSAARNLS